MPSFTTVYRAAVMIVAGVIVVKGWQVYGPSTEQMKSFGLGTLEMAQAALNSAQGGKVQTGGAATDPRLAAPAPAAVIPAAALEPAPLLTTPSDERAPARADKTLPSIGAFENPLPQPEPVSGEAVGLPQMYARLEELGASNPQLTPWGKSGQLYRFHCRAALHDAPTCVRHFEAVAVEPVAAVEQVVAKVKAWRAGDAALP
jgi:hypothetical protein